VPDRVPRDRAIAFRRKDRMMIVIDLESLKPLFYGAVIAVVIFYGILWGIMFIGWLSDLNQESIEQWVKTHVVTSKNDLYIYLLLFVMVAPGVYFWLME
jgi:hypothetical protein